MASNQVCYGGNLGEIFLFHCSLRYKAAEAALGGQKEVLLKPRNCLNQLVAYDQLGTEAGFSF